MIIEFIKFIIYSALIVLISKYILVVALRKLAEILNLKPKTVGNIAGVATSMPELLTIAFSSFNGLITTSIMNVLSSNVINILQYALAILLNKNYKLLKNRAIFTDIILVVITILIPLILVLGNVEMSVNLVPVFAVLYIMFLIINNKVHEKYLKKEDEKIEYEIEKEEQRELNNRNKLALYILLLIITGILLFVVGNLLGNTLESLCNRFEISQTIIGILLGFITSIPELITFFESQRHYKKDDSDNLLGVVEATNNLFTSNIMNLFVIQTIGILIYSVV